MWRYREGGGGARRALAAWQWWSGGWWLVAGLEPPSPRGGRTECTCAPQRAHTHTPADCREAGTDGRTAHGTVRQTSRQAGKQSAVSQADRATIVERASVKCT